MYRLTRRIAAVAAICAVAYASSCGSSAAATVGVAGLPSVSALDSRSSSLVTTQSALGRETFARHINAVDQGDAIYLSSAGNPICWAIYRFTPPAGSVATAVGADILPGAGTEAWIGIADYTSSRWELSGPYSDGAAVNLAGNYLSSSGHVCVAVVVDGAHDTWLESVTLQTHANAAPVATFTAMPHVGNPGAAVTLDASASSDVDGSIVKYEWDLDGDCTYEIDGGANPFYSTTLPDPAGAIDVGVRVSDNEGAVASAQSMLESVDCSPVGPLDIAPPTVYQRPHGLLVVDGHPAVFWSDAVDGLGWLYYQRATRADGSEWGEPVLLADDGGPQPARPALVGGKPAVAYNVGGFPGGIAYIPALDALGETWGEPVFVGFAGQWVFELAEIEGRPTLTVASGLALQYTRADDADGASWPEPVEIVPANQGPNNSYYNFKFDVVNGYPALSWFYNNYNFGDQLSELNYLRAEDVLGDSWGAPQTIATISRTYLDHGFHGRALVDGHPAVVVQTTGGQDKDVMYMRAEDPDGADWGELQVAATFAPHADDNSAAADWICLAQIGGTPLITTHNSGPRELMAIRAVDSQGEAWETPTVIEDCGSTFSGLSILCDLHGCPAVVYRKIWGPGSRSTRFAKGF